MEVISIESYLQYLDNVRKRTKNVLKYIPLDKLEWRPGEGRMTFSDMIRHIAAGERFLFVEIAIGNSNSYKGHGSEISADYKSVFDYLDAMREETISLLKNISSKDLEEKITTPTGVQMRLWKWLRLNPEHEIHHRGIIYSNLRILGIKTPGIYTMDQEDLIT